MLYTLPWSRFKLTTSVVIGTDGTIFKHYICLKAYCLPNGKIVIFSYPKLLAYLSSKIFATSARVSTRSTSSSSFQWSNWSPTYILHLFHLKDTSLLLDTIFHKKRPKTIDIRIIILMTIFKSIYMAFYLNPSWAFTLFRNNKQHVVLITRC
jgi:hypothetical protein